MVYAPLRTSAATTFPAPSVDKMYIDSRELKRIRHCSTALTRLILYALAPDQDVLNVSEYPSLKDIRQAIAAPVASSWSSANTNKEARSALPTKIAQGRALDRLRPIYEAQRTRGPAVINGEPMVQAELYLQLAHPINTWLGTRYSRTAEHSGSGKGRSWGVPGPLPRKHTRREVHLPYWGFQVHKDYTAGILSKKLGQAQLSGKPDFLLYVSHHEHPALGEVKTPWSVERAMLERVFTNTLDGIYEWSPKFRSRGASNDRVPVGVGDHTIRQMWGELHHHQSRLTFFANGEDFIFAFKTGDNELTFSDFIHWDNPELYLVFMGFTMFASDAALTQSVNDPNYDLNILNKIKEDLIRDNECRLKYI